MQKYRIYFLKFLREVTQDDDDLAKVSKRPVDLQFVPFSNDEPLSSAEFCEAVFGQP